MERFEVRATPLEGLRIITPEVLGGERGYLVDLACEAEYRAMGLEVSFVDHSVERCARGVVRGLHFQRADAQAKLLAVSSGRILAVAVDLRPESRDFGAAYSVELSSEGEQMLYIPEWYAHGFLTLEANTEVVLNTTTPQLVAERSGIIWDDDVLLIDWQFERYDIDRKWLNISQQDKRLPSFRSYNPNTLWINRPKMRRPKERCYRG